MFLKTFKNTGALLLTIYCIFFLNTNNAKSAVVSLSQNFSKYPLSSLGNLNDKFEQKFNKTNKRGFYDKDLTTYKVLVRYTGQDRTISSKYLDITDKWANFTEELTSVASRKFGSREVLFEESGVKQWIVSRVSISRKIEDLVPKNKEVYLYIRYIGTNENGSFYYIEDFEEFSEEKFSVDKNFEKYQRGLEYLKDGEYEKADEKFSSLSDNVFTTEKANEYLIYFSSAKKFLKEKNYIKASSQINKAIDKNPVEPDMKYVIDSYNIKNMIEIQKNFDSLFKKLDEISKNQKNLLDRIENLEEKNKKQNSDNIN